MPYKDPEKAREYKRKYYSTPKWKEYMREYRKKNKDKIARQNLLNQKLLRDKDPSYRIACSTRSRLNRGLKDYVFLEKDSTTEGLGCKFSKLKEHLEEQFDSKMNWGNYGAGGWHIDHVLPLCLFDLTNGADRLIALHYSNTQPLWERDNHTKKKNYYNNKEKE